MTSPGPITVFCPNDDAFGDLCQKIGVSKMDLMNDPRIPAIVGTHIVQARPPRAPPVPRATASARRTPILKDFRPRFSPRRRDAFQLRLTRFNATRPRRRFLRAVQGALTLADMEGKTLTTMAGNSITVSGGAVNGVSFKKNDIKVDNGIVHAVNAVISP